MEIYSTAKRRLSDLTVCRSAGADKRLMRIVLRGQGLFMELLLRKDGGYAGYIEDTRTCVGMEVRVCTGGEFRKRACCSTGYGAERA